MLDDPEKTALQWPEAGHRELKYIPFSDYKTIEFN